MFEKILDQQFPRMLSQACRDVSSPFYGCFDRNWWHYRIRDFSSIMLQQGGYFSFVYSELEGYGEYREQLRELARASALFWNKRASKKGAFEEYYPWEKGYPPLAFSALQIAKLAAEEIVLPEDVQSGLKKAAKQLQSRFEIQAGNQQIAGLAALAVIRKIQPEIVNESKYILLKEKSLALQSDEGWFNEYDGPDLGYLSVTLDCLYDLYDYSGDADFLNSAEKALEFMHKFIILRGQNAGMHNARNTDYIVPYGICRFLEHEKEIFRKMANDLMAILYGNLNSKDHFFYALDDRYWIHYTGHSVARAERILARAGKEKFKVTANSDSEYAFKDSGYIIRRLNKSGKKILISGKKGGVFTIFDDGETIVSDYGWIARKGNTQYVNHWWSKSWDCKHDNENIEIEGYLFPHKEKVSTPFLHAGLRLISFILGQNITRLLRNVLIFKSKFSDISFTRKISISGASVIVTDIINGINKNVNVSRAPRASKRHVASADSWHPEDFKLNNTADHTETIVRVEKKVTITTIFNID